VCPVLGTLLIRRCYLLLFPLLFCCSLEHELWNFNHLPADRFFDRARDPQQRAMPLSTNERSHLFSACIFRWRRIGWETWGCGGRRPFRRFAGKRLRARACPGGAFC